MVNNIFKGFMLTRSELEGRLRWYEKKYGPYIQKKGLQNWKNLFRRPNMYEWTILIMLILALFLGWAYYRDFQVYEQTVRYRCCEICSSQTQGVAQQIPLFSMNLTINEENSEDEEVT